MRLLVHVKLCGEVPGRPGPALDDDCACGYAQLAYPLLSAETANSFHPKCELVGHLLSQWLPPSLALAIRDANRRYSVCTVQRESVDS